MQLSLMPTWHLLAFHHLSDHYYCQVFWATTIKYVNITVYTVRVIIYNLFVKKDSKIRNIVVTLTSLKSSFVFVKKMQQFSFVCGFICANKCQCYGLTSLIFNIGDQFVVIIAYFFARIPK